MLEEKIIIHELEGGEVNLLNAEQEAVRFAMTGVFICREGEMVLSIDGTEYHMTKHSIIVYFSYSNLQIISHSSDLKGTFIGANLETIQPMFYQVTNFNALFAIKKAPFQEISDTQYETLSQHIFLMKTMIQREQASKSKGNDEQKSPVLELAHKQAEMQSYSLILEVLQCYTHIATDEMSLSRKDEVLHKFISEIYRRYRTEHEVSYYANRQFLTSRYFSAIVKEKSGKSPSQWIATALLIDAQNLLKTTNMTIKEISDTLHFPNQSYFGKWFKNLTSFGPLEFRKGKHNKKFDDADFADVIQRGLHHIRRNANDNQHNQD